MRIFTQVCFNNITNAIFPNITLYVHRKRKRTHFSFPPVVFVTDFEQKLSAFQYEIAPTSVLSQTNYHQRFTTGFKSNEARLYTT